MSRLNGSTAKFAFIAIAAISLSGVLAVTLAPRVNSYLRAQSERLASEAKSVEQTDPQRAAVRYQMAAFLQPGEHSILKSLADMYVRLDQPDRAIAVLQQLPLREKGSTIAELQFNSGQLEAALETLNRMLNDRIAASTMIAKSRVLLELDRGVEACAIAGDAARYELDNTQAKLQQGLCQLTVGDEAGYATTIASLDDGQAAQTLKSAHGYMLALARTLYTQGLLRTSERVLGSIDDTPTERYLLLGRIMLATSRLEEAKQQLVRATKLDPANLEAHKLLQEVLLKQGDDTGAAEQAKLIKSLQTGQL